MWIILSNTTLSDQGTYHCLIVMDTETKHSIRLEVRPPGSTVGQREDNLGLTVGLPVGLLLALIAAVVGIVLVRKGKDRSPL
ncbi:hypothetical protein ILYODFUR_035572 [Ilyodon furcidens]|uniref:Uncharacterized protein n=1 Tax=Ilyodon furcidens TaxID=33524 RepID=A0ABV0VCA1_9TELE